MPHIAAVCGLLLLAAGLPAADAPGSAPAALPIELNDGDVFVNAALGVRKQAEPVAVDRLLVVPRLGVVRAKNPVDTRLGPVLAPQLGIHAGPGISALEPGAVSVGRNGQLVEVRGFELEPASARVVPGAGIEVELGAPAGDGTRVALTFDVTADAAPGLRRLELIDAAGRRIPPLTPEAGYLLVRAPQPVIESISPALVAPGETFELVIRGHDLRGIPDQNFSTASLAVPEVSITPGDGIAVGEPATVDPGGRRVHVPVAVTADAPAGPRLVQVQTASGTSSDTMSPANTLRVAEASLSTFRALSSPLLGVVRGAESLRSIDLFARPVGVARGPTIVEMDPVAVMQGQRATLTVAGAGLGSAVALRIVPSDGIVLDPGTLAVEETRLQVAMDVASDAPIQPRRVVVELADGGLIEAPELLRILQPAPRVAAITPSFLVRDGTAQTFFVQGSNFSQVRAARLLPGDHTVLQEFTPLSDTTARMVAVADPAAQRGQRVVQVFNETRASSGTPDPFNTLAIVDAADIAADFASPPLGVFKPADDTAPPASVPLPSAALGVMVGPVAFGVDPDVVDAGTTVTMTVIGQELQAVKSVAIEPASALEIDALNIADDGTSLDFELTVNAGAQPGSRAVVLQADNRRIHFTPPEAGLLTIREPGTAVPEAVDDDYTLPANGQLRVEAAQGVLANDTDPESRDLVAVLNGLPGAGSVRLESDGAFTYTPNPDFAGIDRFRYVAVADTAVSASATVTLTVREINDAIDDSYSVGDNAVLAVDAGSGLLANDVIDPEREPVIVLERQPERGELQLEPDGSFSYTPAGISGRDEFTYRLVDGQSRSLPATVTIDIVDVNEPPVARDDIYAVDRDEALEVDRAAGVLANDLDPDGDDLSARLVEPPQSGSLTLASDGALTYRPEPGFVGEDAFVYEAVDPSGLLQQATVTIAVNETLLALPDFYDLSEDEVFAVDATNGLLANDSVVPQGPLEVVIETQTSSGRVEVASDGSFVFQPTVPDYSGTDSFRYFLEDGVNTSPAATVTLNIEPVNDPPRPGDDAFLTDENVELQVPAPGVLENDGDPEEQAIAAEIFTEPESGRLQLDEDGSFSYVPEVNFQGVVTFEYRARDADGAVAVAAATIEVTQPPTATNDVYFVDENMVLEVTAPEEGLLDNDHDAPEDDELTVLPGDPPLNGTLELNPDGTFVYSPDTDFVGIDTFTYRITDGRSESNTATVTFPVGITSFPKAVDDAYTFPEDRVSVVDPADGVLINDTDADTPSSELSAFLVEGARNVDVEMRRDGGFTVTPDPDFFGETFFVYEIFDGTDISNGATVTLTFEPVNDGVNAKDDEFSVERNKVRAGHVGVNDDHDDDIEIRFELVEPPQSGAIEFEEVTGKFRYTPDLDFAGQDSFRYRLFQPATGIEDQARVTLDINAPPVPVTDTYTISEDSQALVTSPLANDFDPDGDAISIAHILHGRRSHRPRLIVAKIEVDDEVQPVETRLTAVNHFYGQTVVPYAVTDGKTSANGEALVTVLPVPDAPVAVDDAYLVAQDTLLIVDQPEVGVQANDFDPDRRAGAGDYTWAAAQGLDLLPLTARLVEPPGRGALVFSPDGTFSYTPEPGFFGTVAFSYELTDATGRISERARAEILVNSPPGAVDDSYVTSEDTALVVDVAAGLLANDHDPENDELTTSLAGSGSGCGPCNGQVRLHGDGSFIYTPDLDFHGQDTFTYRLDDGTNPPAFGSVTITVSPVNDAPRTEPDTYRVREDEVLVAPEPQGVLRNDREVDGDGLADAEVVEPAGFGSVSFDVDGSFSYLPDPDFHGTDTFRYRVFDTTGLFTEDQVEVAVTAVNDPPVADNDSYATEQGKSLRVDAAEGVLANDADVDNTQLAAALIESTERGRLRLEPDGGFEYQPDDAFTGIDRFTYQVDDGLGAVDSATVSITVDERDPGVEIDARDDRFTFTGTELVVPAPGVLGNDTSSDGSPLRAEMVFEPETGSVSLDPDGSFVYRVPPGFEGVDGFTYSAAADGANALARVTLNVFAPQNNPPGAQGESYIVPEDEVLDSRAFASLLSNDSDFENDSLRVVVTAPPANGEIELFDDGNFVYQPAPDFSGEDALSYRVTDGTGQSGEVTATFTVIEVNDPPVAQADLYRTLIDTRLDIPLEQGLLANDSDIEGNELFVEIVDPPDNGQLDAGIDGDFSYVPNPGFTGIEVFDYAATDLESAALAEARIVVETDSTNRAPVARGESFAMDEDQVLTSADVGSLLDNDTDPDGDELLVTVLTQPSHGRFDHDNGTFTYRPEADFFGTDEIVYEVSDGDLQSQPVTATFAVQPVNDAPETRVDRYTATSGSLLSVSSAEGVLANDSDVEGDAFGAVVDQPPANGTLLLEADGSFRYEPVPAFAGRDEFRYLADDGMDQAVGRAVIEVTADGNRPPVAAGEQITIAEDTVLDTRNLTSLLANDHDPDGDPVSIRVVEPPAMGSLQVLEAGHVIYQPQRDATGTERIGYRVGDGALESSTVQLQVELLPVPDDPVARADLYVFSESKVGEALRIPAAEGVLANDSDPDGDELMADLVTPPAGGSVALRLDGSFEYVLERPGQSEDRWRYAVMDPSGREAQQTVTLLLGEAANDDRIFADGFE